MAELRDFFQGASNAAASNLSAPVDGIAWLLRKAGLDIKNPVGGSDWMAAKGLTAVPTNRIAGLLGESFGGVAPIFAAAKAPQIAAGLLKSETVAKEVGKEVGATAANKLENHMVKNGMIQPITTWHGSPHKFDAFDSSKIGTGEGAQAYGHGLYLAEAPEVAGSYAKGLAKPDVTTLSPAAQKAFNKAAKEIAKKSGNASYVTPQYTANFAASKADSNIATELMAYADAPPPMVGNMYKVDLPDEQVAKMLDWDKPLSQQSARVRAAIAKSKAMLPPNAIDDLGGDLSLMYGPNVKPEQFLNTWESFGQKAGGEATLQKLGIPGVRYLDGGSRGVGQGTSNFVVFPGNESLLTILERNGQPVNQMRGLLGQ